MTDIAPPADAGAAPDAAAAAHTGGNALPSALRAFFEPRFGVDFSRVRVHADAESAAAASGLRARAYTIGDEIVFAEGEYAPHSSQGRRLLAHELTHVVQQSGGTAPATPQRKEVPQDTDIRGKQDWTSADRVGNTQRWQDACLTNLKAVDSSQYTRIVERRDFYKWFYEFTASQSYTTRWTLAASVVANGAHQIADIDNDLLNEIANEELGLANVELRGYMREGNQVLFDNVLPKLKKLVDGGPLKGAAALKWDMQVLAEEQTLIQPLYTKMSKDSLQQLDDIARQSGIVGFAASITEDQVAALPHSSRHRSRFTGADLKNIGDRWNYGMTVANTFTPGGIGYNPRPRRCRASAPITRAARSSARSRHAPPCTSSTPGSPRIRPRVGSGTDIVAIIGKLTESEKQQIVSSRGPGTCLTRRCSQPPRTSRERSFKRRCPLTRRLSGRGAVLEGLRCRQSRIVQSYKGLVDTERRCGPGVDALDFTGSLGATSTSNDRRRPDEDRDYADGRRPGRGLSRTPSELAGHQQSKGCASGRGHHGAVQRQPDRRRRADASDPAVGQRGRPLGEALRARARRRPRHRRAAEGGFAIAGDVQRRLESQAKLLQVEAGGHVVASRSFGPRGGTGFVAVTVLEDESLLAGGMADGRGWLLCVDDTLRTRWELPLADVDAVRGLAPLADRGFVLAASQDMSTTQLGMTQLAVFTDEQQPRWRRRLPASGRAEPAALTALAADSLVVVGHRSASERDAARCWVVRLDSAGQPLWERLLGPDDEEQRGRAVAALADGGVLVAGDGLRAGRRGLRVARVAADGSAAWERSYGGGERAQDVAHGIACAADGGFVLVGSTTSKGPGKTNAWVLRLDGGGGLVWGRAFGDAP